MRLRKIVRDLGAMPGRVTIVVIALAASITAVGAVGGAGAIVEREIHVNYLATQPASATLAIPAGASDAAVRIARSRPGVLDAALRTRDRARMTLSGGRRVPLLLFVAPASDPMRIARFAVERGQWPPALESPQRRGAGGEMLLERSSAAYFGIHAGDRVTLQTRTDAHATVRIAGIVHDGAVSPSSQEGAAYGYATPALLAQLGEPAALDELLIVAGHGTQPETRRRRVDAVAEDVGMALRARGFGVTRIDAPPPLLHPHQTQMETAVGTLMTFAVFALVLGAVLAATMIGGVLAQHIRQIGVLKVLGASDTTVFGMYLLLTAAIAAVATLLAIVPSIVAARALAGVIAGLFGIDLTSVELPWQVFTVVIGAGILVPLAAALGTLSRGTSVTVRQAIDGTARAAARFGTTRLQAILGRARLPGTTLRLAVRNVVRRPGRLGLVVALLGASGAVYLTATGTAAGMQGAVDDGMAHRHYDIEVRLSRPDDARTVAAIVNGTAGVAAYETSISAGATIPHAGAIDLTRSYPDGGHGSFAMTVLRPGSPFVQLPLTAGRALHGADAGSDVFNQAVIPQQAPDAKVGRDVELSVDGHVARFRLAGIVSDFGNPATAYVTPEGFARATGGADRVSLVRIITRGHDDASRAAAVAELQRRFTGAGIAPRGIVPVTQFKVALNGHVKVLADSISAIAVVMAVAGVLGLLSAIVSGVMERTRELGVLRSIGATTRMIAGIVVTEGLLYGGLSALAAVALSIPLTLLLDAFLGTQAFLVQLPYRLLPQAVGLSTAVTLVCAAAAGATGAVAAARLTIRDALARA